MWYKTALILHDKGYKVSAIVADWKEKQSPQITELITLGVNIIKIDYTRTMAVRIRTFLKSFLGERERKLINSAVKKIGPDLVVHSTMGPRGASTLVDVMASNIPYALDIQLADDFLWHVCDDSSVSCYKNAKAVYFLSQKNQNATEKQLGTRLSNARRHYNPIKTSSSLGPIKDSETVRFACVGRMGVEHKRQDLILEILASDTWRNRPWELYLYGRGEHLDSIKRLAKMYGIENKVFFEGYIQDIDSVWEKCQALLLPSTYEGMSLAIMECMQAGRVPVVTNTGGNTEFIIDGQSGFIAEAATYNLFADAMERAWTQKSNWANIGLAARERLKVIVPEEAATYFANELIACL